MFQGNPFDVSKRHQRGILVLISTSIIIIFTPRLMMSLHSEEFSTELHITPISKNQHWRNETHRWNRRKNTYRKWSSKQKKLRKPTEKFDPNLLSKEAWMSFGLSEKQASVVLKIAKRGIHSNEELQKIKFIPEKVFENIKEFTKYDVKEQSKELSKKPEFEPSKQKLNINQTSEQELMEIKGLGPFYARQIMKYQQSLGGFVRKEQLLEVWKMTPEIYAQIQAFIHCEPSNLRKISINTASAEELQAHPYLNWNQANSIVKMRTQKGRFHSILEIKESVIIDEETFEKVRPYLSL
jgi:DNA uptake protein ComE-like DNA-binding protein